MARPRLSVVGLTRDSADRLERWAALAREYADEIALLVDADTGDDTVEVARRVADRVQVVGHPGFAEVTMDWGLRGGTGEWLLWLDDDEVVDPGFAEVLDELLDDRDVTHYWQPERWVVPAPGGGYGWLRGFPWYPDHHLRLFRGVGSVYSHRGRLHSPFDVVGEGRVLEDPRTAIYHLNLAMRDRPDRERRMERYRGHPAPSCEEYYLWEDYAATTEIVPLDPAVVEREPGAAARERAAAAARTPAPDEGPPVTVERLRASIARHAPDAPIFSARYTLRRGPQRVLANRGYNAEIEVVNTSAVRWRTTGPETGRVVLSYHWVHAEHGLLLRDGDATLLPGVLDPGVAVTVPAGFWTPYEPGVYRLEWDLRAIGVNWFSERGVTPLGVDIEVGGEDRILTTPRTVARLPRRAATPEPAPRGPARPEPAPPAPGDGPGERTGQERGRGLPPGANVVPLPPVRVLDTRDGSGVPGVPVGPIRAGQVVVVDVIAHPHVPDTAVGVVGTLSVPWSDFNGFVSAYPTGATGAEGTIALYFTDRDAPDAGQIVSALSGGSEPGRLSIRVSDNYPGTVHLLLDLVAYLD